MVILGWNFEEDIWKQSKFHTTFGHCNAIQYQLVNDLMNLSLLVIFMKKVMANEMTKSYNNYNE